MKQSMMQLNSKTAYKNPKEEERIFMFLDMKSSTNIAEKMGHSKYFEMLREYFSDLSDPIVKHKGEIYQYVGDEIVVSWKLSDLRDNSDCLKCFFDMKESLLSHSDKYVSSFGILPTFKAGFHVGEVSSGEIGVIKKEMVYTGDVLNTTARIESLCNSSEVDILISHKLKSLLSFHSEFEFETIGKKELRGKSKAMELFTVYLN